MLKKFASAASALLLFAIGVQATSIAANATTQPDRTTTIVGFAPDSAVVPAKIKNQIVSFVAAHPNYTKVSCTGYTFDLGKKVTNFKLGLKRAQGACKAAVKASSALSIEKQSGNRSTAKKDQFRGVKIVLSSYVEPTATISFELNGGTSGTSNTTVNIGESTTLPTVTRDGYNFTGWFSDQALSTLVGQAGASYTPTASSSLYAGWSIIVHTITFDFGGGVGTPSSVDANYGSTVTLPTPTRDGYTFAGWFSDAGLTTSVGNAGDTVTPSASATFYAKWTANDPVLTLVWNPGAVWANNMMDWFCSPGNTGTPCNVTNQRTVSGRTAQNVDVTPASYPNANGTFNVSIGAPAILPANYIIGPGAGITCLMRNGGPLAGTANGTSGPDWTGAGAGYRFYWYTGCSFDAGVTHAYFYNEQR